jgi:hypothetical protein
MDDGGAAGRDRGEPADRNERSAADGDGDVGADNGGDAATRAPPPQAPRRQRGRLRSASLWGVVGGLAFLVLAQGYLLAGGTLPFAYPWLFGLAAAVAVAAAGTTYRIEHRIGPDRPKRRT